ncbi:MAG TPA: sugar kinase [Geminicoccaceae bacterium]|jgi:2-dehydro-3-deoxygluconokinase|nr:sugar kinase [Geminicoccaceae bacterium]
MAKVASIGECMIELRHRGERELDLAYGGDTLNFAVYLARLTRGRDAAVDYVTALGEDPYSDAMLAMWRSEGIGCELVARLPGRLPGLYTIRTDAHGERTFTYWRSASAARDVLQGEHGACIAERLAGYDLLYLSGITLSILDPAQRERLMALADAIRAKGARVVFDSNFRPAGWPDRDEARTVFDRMLRRVDIVLPTLDDDQALFGVEDAAACARRLHDLGVAEVAVKLGHLGCRLSWDGRSAGVPAEPVARVVDSTAAGDSFNAGYLSARLAGAEPETAARLGNRLAARVIAHPGAVIPVAAMTDLMPEEST